MIHTNTASSSKSTTVLRRHVNWHEAASCAVQIELRDYADLLDFRSEFVLGKNSYRIDLLVIRMLSDQPIPKNIARLFKTCNLFEIKGIHSSVSISSYYKTIGYAGLFIDQASDKIQYTSLDITISFLTFHYPRKLIRHLRKERNLPVEKFAPGIYYIHKEIFGIQIIVTSELPPEENLYLRCLAINLPDASMTKRLADDYAQHKDLDIYIKYLNQLATASLNTKGESSMVCEGLFNLFGTSSEEVIARARKESEDYYLPQIDYLKDLLEQNNIAFDLSNVLSKNDVPNQ